MSLILDLLFEIIIEIETWKKTDVLVRETTRFSPETQAKQSSNSSSFAQGKGTEEKVSHGQRPNLEGEMPLWSRPV
jgi:hypothetical protein